jgi:S1-C subfamily serine protease
VLVEQESRMPSLTEWKVPLAVQPRAEDYDFDLERALASVVGLHSIIPNDAFTADTLGVERAGNGVLIGDGLVLTIGYLITEAETVWLHLGDGRVVQGHALGFDQDSGFGLVQALGRIDLDPLPLGASGATRIEDRVVVGGVGGRTRSLAGRIAAKQEFAGYWEYALEEAIFTYPAHPNWGGAALISAGGELIGIGSLQIERAREGKNEHLNMIVPIDLLKPVFDDLRKFGRVNKPARPWLGVYSTEMDDRVVVAGIAAKGPAARAEIKPGDLILAVKGAKVSNQMEFYRRLWALGPAGVDVPLTLYREGDTFDVSVKSSDRAKFLKAPRLH